MAVLGVDFGTSNSACGVMSAGQPRLIELEAGAKTMPTAVFFDFDTKDTLFGAAAQRALIDGREGRYMRALKSVLGTDLMNEKRRIMGESLDFIDIIARFLSRLKNTAEAATGHRFDRALSGRPVQFHSADANRDARALTDLRACYARAGFDEVTFLLEPEAAAIANGAIGVDGIGLIVDIGGGTSDFTLFQAAQRGGIDVIASRGLRIGGTDFDRSLSLDHVMPLLGLGAMIGNAIGDGALPAPRALFRDLATWEKIPFVYSPQTLREVRGWEKLAPDPLPFARLGAVIEDQMGHDVAFAVERGKIGAADGDGRIDLRLVEQGLSAFLTTAELQRSLGSHADAIGTCAHETCATAGILPADVGTVVFVGGSSLMALIEVEMAKRFPRATVRRSDPFTGVVDGLTIMSATAFASDGP